LKCDKVGMPLATAASRSQSAVKVEITWFMRGEMVGGGYRYSEQEESTHRTGSRRCSMANGRAAVENTSTLFCRRDAGKGDTCGNSARLRAAACAQNVGGPD